MHIDNRFLDSFCLFTIPLPSHAARLVNPISILSFVSVEDVVKLLESVVQGLEQKSYDEALVAQISKLNIALKSLGSQLELFYKDQFDKAQIVFRDSCKDGNLNLVGRLHLLEILELRGMNWVLNDNVLNYYKQKHQVIQVRQWKILRLKIFKTARVTVEQRARLYARRQHDVEAELTECQRP